MSSGVVKKNRELQEENKELRAALAAIKGELKQANLQREHLEFQMEKLRRMLFGRRSEKLPVRTDGHVQLELFEEAKKDIETEEIQELETISYERKKRRGTRRPIPEEIHREQIVLDVDAELRVCPDCGEDMECIGHDVSEDLEYIPALLFVVEYLLKKYACKKCQSGVVGAKRPPRPLKKVKAGPGLLAYVLVSKYQDHLPLHRQERIFGRHGMELSRKTLCDWVQKLAELLRPIVEAQKRKLLEATLLQVDETPVNVKNPEVEGKTSRAYIWSYGIPDEEVVYDFTMGRSSAGPEEFFGGVYPPYLQSDSYSVYTSLGERGKTGHVGCWAHSRRKYYEARAEDPKFSQLILAAIQKLFRIERQAKSEGLRGEALVARRRTEALPVLDVIEELLKAKRPDVLPESGIGEAIDYTIANWKALKRYVEIPEAELSNNSAERSLRGVVLGRKNWLFVGHPKAGPRAAVILSLVETCRRLGIEPYKYLKDVIAELARHPGKAAELTPRRWLERERVKAEKVIQGSGE
jgi:transposase